ncbi:MAG: hypothetical protein E7009_04575 [Alphaproteobacteria bacterium]|nr:hypothetical protein [Alphaproteobacteria bacterium]
MKKLLTLTAVGAILTAPAFAVQKCVALDASTTTCTSTQAYGNADWSTTCTTNGTSVPIKGIAMCSNQAADAQYGTSDAIKTVSGTTDTTNVNCWCKMVEPAVSSWVLIYTYTSAGYCAFNCSYNCAWYAQRANAYLYALFGSLAN